MEMPFLLHYYLHINLLVGHLIKEADALHYYNYDLFPMKSMASKFGSV